MDNKTTMWVIVGLGLMFLFSGQKSQGPGTQRYYRLRSGQVVRESELPQYGYVRYEGRWVRSEALNQVTQRAMSTADWQRVVDAGFSFAQQGINIWAQLRDLFGSDSNAVMDPDSVLDSNPNTNTGWA